MKKVPFLLGLLFITLTISRVAEFFGNDSRAWLMALALAAAVYACAYLAGFKTSQRSSLIALAIFVIIEGFFNTIETVMWSFETGRWNSQVSGFYIYRVADIIYGIFPTIAAGLLAWVAKNADRIPDSSRKGNWKEKLASGISEWFAGRLPESSAQVPAVPEETPRVTEALPEWLPIIPKTKEEFRQLYQEGIIQIPEKVSSAKLAEYLPVGERSVRDWITYAKNGHND